MLHLLRGFVSCMRIGVLPRYLKFDKLSFIWSNCEWNGCLSKKHMSSHSQRDGIIVKCIWIHRPTSQLKIKLWKLTLSRSSSFCVNLNPVENESGPSFVCISSPAQDIFPSNVWFRAKWSIHVWDNNLMESEQLYFCWLDDWLIKTLFNVFLWYWFRETDVNGFWIS